MRKAKPSKPLAPSHPPGIVCIPVEGQLWTEAVVALDRMAIPNGSLKARVTGQEGPAAKRNLETVGPDGVRHIAFDPAA